MINGIVKSKFRLRQHQVPTYDMIYNETMQKISQISVGHFSLSIYLRMESTRK